MKEDATLHPFLTIVVFLLHEVTLEVLVPFLFRLWCNSIFCSSEQEDTSYFPVKGQKKKALF